jgi:hypothetical protein
VRWLVQVGPNSLLDVQPSTSAKVNVCKTIDEAIHSGSLATKNQGRMAGGQRELSRHPKLTPPENAAGSERPRH